MFFLLLHQNDLKDLVTYYTSDRSIVIRKRLIIMKYKEGTADKKECLEKRGMCAQAQTWFTFHTKKFSSQKSRVF